MKLLTRSAAALLTVAWLAHAPAQAQGSGFPDEIFIRRVCTG